MEIITTSVYFGTAISLAAYLIGFMIRQKTGKEIFNPIIIAIVIVISLLLVFDIDYKTYNATASHVSYFLTPTTICLALPLYRQLEVLKKNFMAIMAGIVSGVLTSCFTTYILSVLLSLSDAQYFTLLPKSITTAIGLPLSEEIGGIGDITVAVIILTGIFGNLIAVSALKLFRIKSPIAKGIAIGSASHAMGTAKAMEIGEIEGAMSSLSIAISGIVTVILVQLFVGLV